jgi:hypothetical protein
VGVTPSTAALSYEKAGEVDRQSIEFETEETV